MEATGRSKEDITGNVYTDLAGFGSIKNTLNEVCKLDPSIAVQDSEDWIEKNTLDRDLIPT